MAREWASQSFTVPVTSGSYAPERLTFGDQTGVLSPGYDGVTVHVHASVATMVVELWLPRVGAVAPYVNSDYKYSGEALAADTGSKNYLLSGYPGAQFRVRSGGTAGAAELSASAKVSPAA